MPVMQLLLLIFMQDADKGILKITDWPFCQYTEHNVEDDLPHVQGQPHIHIEADVFTPRGIGETCPGAGDVAIPH
jgi:hypothetical protein